MKIGNVVLALSLMLSAEAMACEGMDILAERNKVTLEQFARNIAELEHLGIIENRDGRFVLKDDSALERLRRDGRVDLVTAADRSICW